MYKGNIFYDRTPCCLFLHQRRLDVLLDSVRRRDSKARRYVLVSRGNLINLKKHWDKRGEREKEALLMRTYKDHRLRLAVGPELNSIYCSQVQFGFLHQHELLRVLWTGRFYQHKFLWLEESYQSEVSAPKPLTIWNSENSSCTPQPWFWGQMLLMIPKTSRNNFSFVSEFRRWLDGTTRGGMTLQRADEASKNLFFTI